MTFKSGDLFKNRHPHGNGWCKHGLVLIDDKGDAVDTYWGAGQCENRWKPEAIQEHLEFVININDCRTTNRDEWETFADVDRGWIPMGAYSERFYVRQCANPDPARLIDSLEYKLSIALSDAEHAIDKARRYRGQIECSRQSLREIEKSRAIVRKAMEE